MSMNDKKRYDLFGWDYQAINPLSQEEVAWYLRWAQETGGPLLGLACGGGRLLCRLADAGFDVTGLDLSEKMLSMARQLAAELPGATQARIRLLNGDMSDFYLGRQFGLIFIADNSFRELPTRKDLLACLKCIRRHLAPDGRLLITERRFNPSLFPGGLRSFGWSAPRPHPETGHLVSRRGEIRLSKDGRRMRGEFIYKTVSPGGQEAIETCPIVAPILSIEDYSSLFQRAGFYSEVFSGYKNVPDDGSDPFLCFVCRHADSKRSTILESWRTHTVPR